jgi:hypothetical protein
MYPLELKDVIDPFIDEALDYAGDENDIKVYLKGMIAALPIIMQELQWHGEDTKPKVYPGDFSDSSSDFCCPESSVISDVEYWPKVKELFIHFRKTGKLYAYQNVPQNVYNGLRDSDSRGKYFNQNISKRFK